MAWVVDSSVLLDIRVGTPKERAVASAGSLMAHVADGLVVCPITFIEISPAFRGDSAAQRRWLDGLKISSHEPWLEADTERANFLWNEHIQRKRQGQMRKRPVADILIAAFSRRFQGLITSNAVDFHNIDSGLNLVVPNIP